MTDETSPKQAAAFSSEARTEFAELTVDYDGGEEWNAVVAARRVPPPRHRS